MFAILPESRAARTRRLGGTIASVLVHATLIAGAVGLTMTRPASAGDTRDQPRDTIIFVPATPSHAPRQPAGGSAPATPAPDVPRIPVVEGTWTMPPVTEVVVEGPATPPTDDLGGARRSGMPTTGTVTTGTGLGGGGVVGERETDRAPRVLGAAPEPRYPDALRGAGISGRVVAQFVVDTAGRAEPGSLELLDASRAEFGEAVRQVLPRYRFVPGEVAGRRVRTRVQLPFTFEVR